jgi:hypothetical protein
MLSSLLVVEGVLLACVLAGWGLGLLLSGRVATTATRDAAADDAGEDASDGVDLTDALGFVGAAFGIILGLLLVFAVQHFNDASTASREESMHAVAVFQAASPYPSAEKKQLRRDVSCTMRSIAADDFPAAAELDLNGADATSAWLQRVQSDIETLPQDTPAQQSTHQLIAGETIELFKARQMMLVGSQPEIPLVIWLVIYASAFAFTLLLVLHLSSRRRLAAVSVISVTVVLLVVMGVLTDLDFPFSGEGGSLKPTAVNASLASLEHSFPTADWSTCPPAPTTSA